MRRPISSREAEQKARRVFAARMDLRLVDLAQHPDVLLMAPTGDYYVFWYVHGPLRLGAGDYIAVSKRDGSVVEFSAGE